MEYFKWFFLVFLIVPINGYSKTKKVINKTEIKISKEIEIYNKIIKWNKGLDKFIALEIAYNLVYNSKLYGINVDVATAIIRQESNFRNIHTYKITSQTKKYCEGVSCYKITTEETRVFDLGISQINLNTAIGAGLDVDRLFNKDLEYQIKSFFQILRAKIALCQELGITPSFSCYHSINVPQRDLYVSLVNQYINP